MIFPLVILHLLASHSRLLCLILVNKWSLVAKAYLFMEWQFVHPPATLPA